MSHELHSAGGPRGAAPAILFSQHLLHHLFALIVGRHTGQALVAQPQRSPLSEVPPRVARCQLRIAKKNETQTVACVSHWCVGSVRVSVRLHRRRGTQ